MTDEPSSDPIHHVERIGAAVQAALVLGKTGVKSAARGGKNAVLRYQLEAELDDFWVRLGKLAFQIAQSEGAAHPGVERAVKRIEDLQRQIAEIR